MNRITAIALIIAGSAAAASIVTFLAIGRETFPTFNAPAISGNRESGAENAASVIQHVAETRSNSPTAPYRLEPQTETLPPEPHTASKRPVLASQTSGLPTPRTGGADPISDAAKLSVGDDRSFAHRGTLRIGSADFETSERILETLHNAPPARPAVPNIVQIAPAAQGTSSAPGIAPKATDVTAKPAAQTATRAASMENQTAPAANPTSPAAVAPSPMESGHFTRNLATAARPPRVWPKPFTPEEERLRQQMGVQAYINLQHELATGHQRMAE